MMETWRCFSYQVGSAASALEPWAVSILGGVIAESFWPKTGRPLEIRYFAAVGTKTEKRGGCMRGTTQSLVVIGAV